MVTDLIVGMEGLIVNIEMQVRVITMKYNEGQQGFSEEALRSATFGRDVLAVETHFFMHGGAPHLTLVLQLADASSFDAGGTFKPRDPNAPNPEEALPEELRGVYRDLKKWRNEKAKRCWNMNGTSVRISKRCGRN